MSNKKERIHLLSLTREELAEFGKNEELAFNLSDDDFVRIADRVLNTIMETGYWEVLEQIVKDEFEKLEEQYGLKGERNMNYDLIVNAELVRVGAISLPDVFEVRLTGEEPGLSEHVERITRELSRIAGGASVTPGTGAWVNGEGVLEQEPSILITSNTENAAALLVQVGWKLLTWMVELDQEAIWFSLNGSAFVLDRENFQNFLFNYETAKNLWINQEVSYAKPE